MKAKLMALLLAAGLGVTGVAMTAQAAEAGMGAVNECAHSGKLLKRVDVIVAENLHNGRHSVTYMRTYFCPECQSDVQKAYSTHEPHEYEQIYFDDGRVMSYCIICDDCCFW